MRFPRLNLLLPALALGAGLLAGCAVNPPVATDRVEPLAPAALRDRIGVSASNTTLWEPDASVRHRTLQAIADSGARWVTVDLDWNSINGAGPAVLRWGPMDQFVREARGVGLTIMAVAGYTPAWAAPPDCPAGSTHCLPASPEPYANFMKLAAAAVRLAQPDRGPAQRRHVVADLERAEPLPVRAADRRRREVHLDAEARVRRDPRRPIRPRPSSPAAPLRPPTTRRAAT